MARLIKIGESDNIPVYEYWVESEEEMNLIQDAPLFSKCIIVTEAGDLIIAIKRSNGWIKTK